MLSLLKKSDQAQTSLVPAWHPNFRNQERLPDTKVVRTQFFLNFAAIAVTASLLLFFCYQEYQINGLSRQVANSQVQIDTNRKSSEQVLSLSKKFADEAKKIDELGKFVKAHVVLSGFLEHLGKTLPANLAIDVIDFRTKEINLRGIATGSPDEASGRTSAYLEQLRRDAYIKGIFADVTLNKLQRDQVSGQLSFDISLNFKEAGGKK